MNTLTIDLSLCFECGKPKDDMHHIIPKSKGGTKMIPLCSKCHGLVHDKDFLTMKALRKIGIEKAIAKGKYKGRLKDTVDTPEEIFEKHKKIVNAIKENSNLSLRKISEMVSDSEYSVSPNTVKKVKDLLNK